MKDFKIISDMRLNATTGIMSQCPKRILLPEFGLWWYVPTRVLYVLHMTEKPQGERM